MLAREVCKHANTEATTAGICVSFQRFSTTHILSTATYKCYSMPSTLAYLPSASLLHAEVRGEALTLPYSEPSGEVTTSNGHVPLGHVQSLLGIVGVGPSALAYQPQAQSFWFLMVLRVSFFFFFFFFFFGPTPGTPLIFLARG